VGIASDVGTGSPLSSFTPSRAFAHPLLCRFDSRRVIAQVLNAPGQIADHPEENIHRRGLDVPSRFPPRYGVRTQPEKTRQVRLREIESFTDSSDLVGREQPVASAIESDRIFM